MLPGSASPSPGATPRPGGSRLHPANNPWIHTKPGSIEKVAGWQRMSGSGNLAPWLGPELGLGRGRTPSFEALRCAVADLYRIDDFHLETLGAGFFSDVYKVTHKTTQRVMVLKMNKYKSNKKNMLKEIQLMNKLKHPNILRFEAVCVHEGELHALTEYVAGGNLEQLILDLSTNLPWAVRVELALHIAKGLLYLNSQGMFHRDLTSKNILIKKEGKLTAVIGDFGLATSIPKQASARLPQVGSPYWMSPECLHGKYYDHTADIFSFGIVLCELIARCDADPDVLPRTQNFGVDYLAFAEMAGTCPPDFLKLAFTCVSIDPHTRPKINELVSQLKQLLEVEREDAIPPNRFHLLKRFMSEGEVVVRKSPSEKARLHSIAQHPNQDITVKSVGEEMCQLDPHYTPRNSLCANPFATLPRLREGRKIIGSSVDLFSSCFELPSPRVSSPTDLPSTHPTRSLPASPTNPTRGDHASATVQQQQQHINVFEDDDVTNIFDEDSSKEAKPVCKPVLSGLPSPRYRGARVSAAVKKMYANRLNMSQDDSALGLWSGVPPLPLPLKRWGSVESGFCSTSEDWFSGPISSRSICSSLLTVSDLEEDLRAASAFLYANKRTSSVFTDSIDDLSSRLDDISNTGGVELGLDRGYEKDIRDIVEYFERNCRLKERSQPVECQDTRTSPEIARSQKIESLIKRVAENKNRARLTTNRRHTQPQNLQVCEGIVSSQRQKFDVNRRPPRGFDQKAAAAGFVKSRRALFDPSPPSSSKAGSGGTGGRKLVGDIKRQRDSKLSKLAESYAKPTAVAESSRKSATEPRKKTAEFHK